MKINSNKDLLDIISKNEVGIKYPDLIPRIAFNILIQKRNMIVIADYYYHFYCWFRWSATREGHAYWDEIDTTLSSPIN